MSIIADLLAMNAKSTEVQLAESDDPDAEELENMAALLEEHHEKMVHLMSEVQEIVRMLPRHYRGQAEAYWIPHILIALGGEHGFMTANHESTMQKMIEEMNEEAEAYKAHDADGGAHPDE